MEFASRIRWFLLVITVIILLVLVGWFMFSIARSLFSGTTSNDEVVVSQEERYNVLGTNTAKLIVDGPIVANEDHRSYEIAVSERVVTMKVFSHYGDELMNEVAYKNSSKAYDSFLEALDKLGVTDRQKDTDKRDDKDELGYCHNGNRYIVELDNAVRRWNTSCSSKLGTAGFDMPTVRYLFEDQIPEFSDVVYGAAL